MPGLAYCSECDVDAVDVADKKRAVGKANRSAKAGSGSGSGSGSGVHTPTMFSLTNFCYQRFALRCILCKEKGTGACVQCDYKKCTRSVHPWCLMHSSENALVETEEGGGADPALKSLHAAAARRRIRRDLYDAVSGQRIDLREDIYAALWTVPTPIPPEADAAADKSLPSSGVKRNRSSKDDAAAPLEPDGTTAVWKVYCNTHFGMN